jgi:hypothetical protein
VTCALGFGVPWLAVWWAERRHFAAINKAYEYLLTQERHDAAQEARRENRWKERVKMNQDNQKRLDQIKAVFSVAARLVKVKTSKAVGVEVHADRALVTVGDDKPIVFTINSGGAVYGPGATMGVGNINDDGIEDTIATAIVNDISKRSLS